MIDRAARGAHSRRRRRREVEGNAGQLILDECRAGVWRHQRRAKRLRVPRLHLRVLLAEEMDVMQLNRSLLITHFDELDLHVFRAERERNVRSRARRGDVVGDLDCRRNRVRRNHLEAVRLDLRNERLQVRDGEANVIHGCPDRAAGRRLHWPEEDKHIRKFDDLLVVLAELDELPAQGVDEELLLRVHVRCVQMVMAIDDRTLFANENLRVRRAWQSQNEAEGKRGRRHRCWNHSTQRYLHGHLLVRIANIALYLDIRRFRYFDSIMSTKVY